jgi:hypothetical protein
MDIHKRTGKSNLNASWPSASKKFSITTAARLDESKNLLICGWCSNFHQPKSSRLCKRTSRFYKCLVTNFEKSSIHPIKCENIDLENVPLSFPGAANLPHADTLGSNSIPDPYKKNSCATTNWDDRAAYTRLEKQAFKPGRPSYFGNLSSLLRVNLSSHHLPPTSLGEKANWQDSSFVPLERRREGEWWGTTRVLP